MTDIDRQLRDLSGLWIDPSTENLARIPALCHSIEMMLGGIERDSREGVDRTLMSHIRLLAAKAQQRMDECVAIQTRTGSYSVCGTHELSSRVATTGWEG